MARACPECGREHDVRASCLVAGVPAVREANRIGSVIANRYVLVRRIGDGGMGTVYKAADQTLRRFVAVKLLHAGVATSPRGLGRFEREARAAAAIGHPNIVEILDFVRVEGELPFLVMEYIRGRSLAQVLAAELQLTTPRACSIATHTLAGLAAAHERGVLHRDLKPGNLMLVPYLGDPDFVKILDFGFAALLDTDSAFDDPEPVHTPARTLVGTPAYAPPECLRGDGAPSAAADVYAVAVVLFEMLSGIRPFRAATLRELVVLVASANPPPLGKLRPDLPQGLVDVIERGLAKDPAARWPSAAAFASALVPFGGREVFIFEAPPSDIFSMDLLKIRAREDQSRRFRRGELGVAKPPAALADVFAADATVKAPPPLGVLSRAATDGAVRVDPWNADRRESARPPGARVPTHPPETGERGVAGFLIHALLRFMSRRYGDKSVGLVLASLPAPFAALLADGVPSDEWVSFGAFASLLRHIDLQLGRDDLHLIVDCGCALADGVKPLLREDLDGARTPESLLLDLPGLAPRLFHGVSWTTAHVGKGYARVDLREEGEPSVEGCIATLGLFDRLLEVAGAREREVNLLACRALGDSDCHFDLTWLA